MLVPPEAGKVRSLTISCSFLEKSKSSLNRVKCASKCVKRLIITAINKDSVPHVGYSRLNGLQPSVVGSFSDSIIFAVHTRKTAFSTVPFSNRSTLESVFELIRFR